MDDEEINTTARSLYQAYRKRYGIKDDEWSYNKQERGFWRMLVRTVIKQQQSAHEPQPAATREIENHGGG